MKDSLIFQNKEPLHGQWQYEFVFVKQKVAGSVGC
jgi:hypothetical protein